MGKKITTNSEKSGCCSGQALLILVALAFLPVTIIVLIAKSKLKPKVKAGIIAAWCLICVIGMALYSPSPENEVTDRTIPVVENTVPAITTVVTTEIEEVTTVTDVETTIETTTSDVATTSIEEEISNIISFNKEIKGRGNSDISRSEPNYVGLYGYVSVYNYNDEDFDNTPWKIPTYSQIDLDHFEESGEIDHKSVVKVNKQILNHEGWGRYSGYLYVNYVNNPDLEYIIDVKNFITNDYWNMESILDSVAVGDTIAEYNQKSGYLPTDRSNDIVDVSDGTHVLICDKTGSGLSVDRNVRQVEGICCVNGVYKTVCFNTIDLIIIY